MNESILLSIKKLIGYTSDYDVFDADFIVYINTAFMILNQLGIGPANPFVIHGVTECWNDFLDGSTDYEMVKSYVMMQVKMMHDPPTSSGAVDSINERIKQFEWRLNVAAENALIDTDKE